MEGNNQHLTNVKVELNRRELQVMRNEEEVERKRERELKYVRDPLERKRLRNIHAIERARFSERLRLLVLEHEALLREYMDGK